MYKHQLSRGNYSLTGLAPEVLKITSTLPYGGRKEQTYIGEGEECKMGSWEQRCRSAGHLPGRDETDYAGLEMCVVF